MTDTDADESEVGAEGEDSAEDVADDSDGDQPDDDAEGEPAEEKGK